ncbi:hypothetical protein [Fimbriiglobus ruber]|uniref:hypothetical protein n=1 Tax=Fimbriiglobus ruber TaxID=1908690 RepID=UPI000B4C0E18|nr:hypothetical protein [Fimbriiglobus ruber]
MSVGGTVYNMANTKDGFTKFWVRDNRDRTCVIGDESNLRPKVSLGETIWWQSGKIYVHRDGKDVPFPKIGYSTDAGPKFTALSETADEATA